jgi:hypothetical protein
MGAVSIPPRKKVLAAYSLHEYNPKMKVAAIARAVGAPRSTVAVWLAKPAFFDPYYDRVAIRRALNGDVSAYRALTYYEYRLVIALLERDNRGGETVTGRFPPEAAEMIETALRKRRNRLRATGALEALNAA